MYDDEYENEDTGEYDDSNDDSQEVPSSDDDVSFSEVLSGLFMVWDIQNRQREAAIKEEKRARKRRFYRKHKKVLNISMVLFSIGVLVMGITVEIKKMIPIGYSTSELVGRNWEEVVCDLQISGFNYVWSKGVKNLTVDNEDKVGKVFQVSILGDRSFSKTTEYPYNFPVIVKYHELRLLKPPLNYKEAKKMSYTAVEEAFKDAGFVNVKVVALEDMVTGWIVDEGEIDEITVDGKKEKFEKTYDEFRPDAEIVITYHSFKVKK